MTLNIPEDIYQRAERVARTTEQPVEQVIVGWITPPPSVPTEAIGKITELEQLSDEKLVQIARSTMPESDTVRLRDLLAVQRERGLTEAEQREAAALVEREDLYTLSRARALYLLKKRDALPDDLRQLLDEARRGLRFPTSTS